MESHYSKVYTGNFITVQLIAERLRDIGIEPISKDNLQLGLSAMLVDNYDGLIELYVHEDELSKAVPIVQSILAKIEAQ